MIKNIQDACITKISPILPDQDLCSFSLTSTWSRDVCFEEITKRAKDYVLLCRSTVILNKKMDVFSQRVENLIIGRIESVLLHFNPEGFLDGFAFFHHIVSNDLLERMRIATKNTLVILEAQKTKNKFYTQLRADHEDRAVVSCCAGILEQYEIQQYPNSSGPYPYITIDVSQNCLSVGTLACFSFAKRQMDSQKDELLFFDSCFKPMGYFNNMGHKAITLTSSSERLDQEIQSPESLEELALKVGSLMELRMLDLTIGKPLADIRLRASFVTVLQASASLPKLRTLLFHFLHEISNIHIEDIFDCVKERKNLGLSLQYIGIQCVDITLKQTQTLVKNLDSLKNPITIDLAVLGRLSQNIQEISDNEEQLSTQFVNFQFRIIV